MSYIVFLDDIELYQYHKWNYTEFLFNTINNVNVVNSIRLAPLFLDNLLNFKIAAFEREDKYYQTNYLQDDPRNPNSFYFLYSSQSIYLNSLISCLIIYAMTKLAHLLLLLIHRYSNSIGLFVTWLGNGVRWWSLITMIIETNIMKLSFNAFLQFINPLNSCHCFENKLNLIATTLTLFSIVLYSFSFYLLVYAYSQKKPATVLLDNTKYCPPGFFL